MNYRYFSVSLLVTFLSISIIPNDAMAQANILQKEIGQNNAMEDSPILVRAGISSALDIGRMGSLKFYDAPGMKAFYGTRGYEPIWIQGSFLGQQKVQTILNVLENAWTHGLNPNQYHIDEIRQLMDTTKAEDRYQLDLVVSDALIRYGRDISAMRVNPKRIGQQSSFWRQPLRGIDILDYVSTHQNTKTALENMAPRGQLYKKLQEELITLYKTPEETNKNPKVIINKVVLPGQTDKAIFAVRQRMGFKTNVTDAEYYDDTLAKAVMAFQVSHGLKADGIVGQQTAKLMNISREDKINQVLANLERLRWVEQNKPRRYIMVNVPSATLWAVEDEKVKIEMPVVVGRPERETNIFTTQVTGIRYNPTWTVPPTIKRDDYLPKLRKDPYYLSDRGIELMEGKQTIDPGSIDWNNTQWSEVNDMRMVQGPGSANPLGKVRFIMNNPFNIYLHDTPTKSYFKKADRAQSSGCIRLERPVELADFVLEPNKNWSSEKRDAILEKGKLTEIYAQEPLPVYILYQTVWLGDRGQIIYGADIYGQDSKLVKALKEIDGIAIVNDSGNIKTANLD